MYLRTSRRKNKDGSVTEYYQLAHNERHPETRKPVAHIVHNFGRADQLDREELVRLCKSIARVCDVEVIDQRAQEEGERTHDALPGDVKLIGTVGLGPVVVIEALWKRLGIGEILQERLCKKKRALAYERALLAMTANRLCEPESKLGVWERWLANVYLPSCDGLLLRQMYEAMDFLHAEASAVEEAVFFHTADLLNLDVDLVFYDTTTAAFSIDEEDEPSECLSNRARSVQWMTFEGVKPSALARLTQHRTSSHPLLRSPIPPSTVQIPIADLHRTTASSSPAVSSSEAYQAPTANIGTHTLIQFAYYGVLVDTL